ncbi:MAG: hypothetical protein AAFY19_12730 [Pseudomonadota bacterium]
MMNAFRTLPDPTDRKAIVEFAGSFNGYEHFGSFAACANAAKAKKRETLIDLRNELFFAYRASHHTGDSQVLINAYEELLRHFETFLRTNG